MSDGQLHGAAGRLEGDRAARITLGPQLRLEFVAPLITRRFWLDFEDLGHGRTVSDPCGMAE